jgi:hypothetical protein
MSQPSDFVYTRVWVRPFFGLTHGILHLALDLLGLALHLLSAVSGEPPDGIANSPFSLLRGALEAVRGPFGGQAFLSVAIINLPVS